MSIFPKMKGLGASACGPVRAGGAAAGPVAAAFGTALAAALPGGLPGRLGVAVSGGGDSMALLVLARDWAAACGVGLEAVTVDHRLRAASADEARGVAGFCAALGIRHEVLCWGGWTGAGNVQAEARAARYRLMADWARARGIGAVALGHTMEDQAETVLLRLARGSGVDGLAGMAARRQALGVAWLRPLLGLRRAALRAYLTERGIGWVEDPSNDDARFDRVKARAALAALAPLGLDVGGLVETAARMADARAALEEAAPTAARQGVTVEAGDVLLDAARLWALPREVRERIVAHALGWVATAAYRPRHAALRRLLDGARSGQGGTLHGCLLSVRGGLLRLSREPRAVEGVRGPVIEVWDGRWRMIAPRDLVAQSGQLAVAALGETGLRACPDWRATGLPRATLVASPAVWRGEDLVAAPLAGKAAGWEARLACGTGGLFKMTLSD